MDKNNLSPMPIKGIKKIIKQELENKFNDILNCKHGHFYNDLISSVKWDLLNKLETDILTYKDLNDFISEYYRMSLNEWIESL